MSIIEKVKRLFDGKEISASVSFPTPTNIQVISKDWLVQNDGRREFIVIHHSATYDNPETFDWRSIDRYHRSFRVSWEIAAPPIDGPSSSSEGRLVRYMGNWYETTKVNQFYAELSEQAGEEVPLFTPVTETVRGEYYETPWRKIGYNLGIERAEDSPNVEYGRSLMEQGGHCYQMGMNALSIGICVIGNYDATAPDGEIWRLTVKVCRALLTAFPKLLILGHHEVQGVLKSCPGKRFDMNQFRSDVLDGRYV